MSAQWSSQVLGSGGNSKFDELLKDEFAVLLLRGKNPFGDLIYCYLKVAMPDISRLQTALKSEAGFNASDFGSVVAAGRGEPTEEVKAEVSLAYPLLKHPAPLSQPVEQDNIPKEKKAWDEY